MKPLTSSSSSSCFCSSVSDIKLHICYSSSLKFHPIHHNLAYFPLTKLPSLHFVSFHSNLLLPVSSSSSSSETGLELAEAIKHESYESKTVHVRFQLKRQCSFGEQFALVGDDPILGFWDPDKAIPLNWSEDHVWNLELDVPVGKSIKFKFILKQISGSIVWQPGPDRILETWDTMNTIVVWEDWEDAAFQKLIEEEPVSSENVDPIIYSETKLAAENFILQNASDLEEKEQFSFEGEAIFAVADNMRSSNEEPAVVQNHQVLEEEGEGDSNEDAVIFEKILENNGRTLEVTNSESINVGEDLMNKEGDPVLVPGLPPEPVNYYETNDNDECKKITSLTGASAGVNEVNMSKFAELEEKHDVEVGRHDDSEQIQVYRSMEQQVEASEDNQQKLNKVIENDIQWGLRTIQRLLTHFGFL